MLNLQNEGRSIYQLTTEEQDLLKSISENKTQAGDKARALLAFVNNETYTPYVDVFDSRSSANLVESSSIESSISVYPNPANTQVTIEINPNLNVSSLQIFNLLGEKVLEAMPKTIQVVDISAWEKGVYLIEIRSEFENKIVKLVID